MIYLVYLAADAGQELSGLGSGGGSPSAGRSSGSSSRPPVCSNQRCQPRQQQTTGLCRCAESPRCSQVSEVSARLFSEKLLFLLLFRAVRAVPLTAEPPRPPRALFSGNFAVISLKVRKPLRAGGVCQPESAFAAARQGDGSSQHLPAGLPYP